MHASGVVVSVAVRQRRKNLHSSFMPSLCTCSCRFARICAPSGLPIESPSIRWAGLSEPLMHQMQRQQHSCSQHPSYRFYHKLRCPEQHRIPSRSGWLGFFWLFRDAWRLFRSQYPHRKFLIVAAGVLGGSIGYVVLCLMVWLWQQWIEEELFSSLEEHPLEEWSLVEPTLREGDIILMMGTGDISGKITAAQYIYSGMHTTALRYSHVAVVVEPVKFERSWSRRTGLAYAIHRSSDDDNRRNDADTSDSITDLADSQYWMPAPRSVPTGTTSNGKPLFGRRPKRGAVIMEAIDNIDVNAPDINGAVRYNCVQLVEAGRRLFGQRNGEWCYRRFAVRRLKGFEWTADRKRLLREFVGKNVGRPLDTSCTLILSYIHPRLYEWAGGRPNGNEVSCGELIVDLYKHCGVIQRGGRRAVGNGGTMDMSSRSAAGMSSAVTQSEDVACGSRSGEEGKTEQYCTRPSIKTAPYQFAEGEEVGVLDFAEGVSLGPEVRVHHPYARRRK